MLFLGGRQRGPKSGSGDEAYGAIWIARQNNGQVADVFGCKTFEDFAMLHAYAAARRAAMI